MIRATAVFLLFSGAASASPLQPPRVSSGEVVPVVAPYDAHAPARAQIDQAFDRARGSAHLVLLDFGANWCPDCRMLAGVMGLPTVRQWIAAHFEIVDIDVGRFDRNLDLARRFGVTIRAIPTVLVLTKEGRVQDPDGTMAMGDARTMSPQAVVDLLAKWGSR